jgi:RNA polymerase sporulation-specific sigma factor
MPLSLYDKCEDEKESGLELIDKIADKSNEDDLIEKIELDTVLSGLNERERKIMVLRFYRDKTQTEVAQTLGVSQVQVSRLESKIIEKMRKKL